MTTIAVSPVSRSARGCGYRKKGGTYLCCGLAPNGLPLESFLIDPVRKMEGMKPFRAPMFYEDKNGVLHVLIWVGEEFYPSPVDFIEETRVKGASRLVPSNFPISRLTPGRSRMIFVHPKAWMASGHQDDDRCPGRKGGTLPEANPHAAGTPCLGSHYFHAAQLGSDVSEVSEDSFIGRIGDLSYGLPKQHKTHSLDIVPGVFMQLPITHIEYEKRNADDEGPETLETLEKRGFVVIRRDEKDEFDF